ncbi:hypothetical protein HNY73_001603 [Argiope bruennichi]|uniref:Uncharacterized protein n=1 Tax=Argiope bruennichi TaxID=94029 RepID=A0A8T0G7Q8_ARGBR|nr:hypothetical protein HNY73_001603 [Argiope bruennichi]
MTGTLWTERKLVLNQNVIEKALILEKKRKKSPGSGRDCIPVEPKRREWYHRPPSITPKQFESVRPPKKNLTPLRRFNAAVTSSSTPSYKICWNLLKKMLPIHFEKPKSFSKESSKKSELDSSKVPKKDRFSVIDDKDKQRSEHEKHEHSTRSEQNRERRRDRRERGVNSRSRGGNSFVNNIDQPAVISGGSARNASSRGRGDGNRSGAYGCGLSHVQSGAALSSGVSAYRGKREYRRSKVERGPRFDRQKERNEVKDDKKKISIVMIHLILKLMKASWVI